MGRLLLRTPSIADSLACATLSLSDVPQLDVSIGANMKHPSVHEGGDVYFECKIRANPPVTEIGWKFEGQPLYPDKHQGKKTNRRESLTKRSLLYFFRHSDLHKYRRLPLLFFVH